MRTTTTTGVEKGLYKGGKSGKATKTTPANAASYDAAKKIAKKAGVNIPGIPSLKKGESLDIEKMEGGHIVTHHKPQSGKSYKSPKKYVIPD